MTLAATQQTQSYHQNLGIFEVVRLLEEGLLGLVGSEKSSS